MAHSAALSSSFGHDLKTEWVPDALGAADVMRELAGGSLTKPAAFDAGWLRVPFASRTESVPVVPPAVRAHLHCLVDQALRHHRPSPEVFSYRSTGWDYRGAYRARQRRMRELGSRDDLPLVLRLDVHRFGASLPLQTLLNAPWTTEALAQAVTELDRATGRCLLPGHGWANRLGTAMLAPVDAVLCELVPKRWIRWGDDWHVFLRDMTESDRVSAAVAARLADLGLRLSEAKSKLVPQHSVLGGPARDVAGDPYRVWRLGLQRDDERALRYALVRLVPEVEVTRSVPAAVRAWPGLLPRAVQYLDQTVDTETGREAVAELWEAAPSDLFTAGRLLALAGRHHQVASWVPDSLLLLAANCEVTGLQALAVRVAALTGRLSLLPRPPARMRPWLAEGASALRYPPSVATLL